MDYYFNCGMLGHDQRSCKQRKVMDITNPGKSMYGPWLRVTAMKKLPAQPKEMVVNDGVKKKEREEASRNSVEGVAAINDENGKNDHALGNEAEGLKDLYMGKKSFFTQRKFGFKHLRASQLHKPMNFMTFPTL